MSFAQSSTSTSAPSFADWCTQHGWQYHPAGADSMYRRHPEKTGEWEQKYTRDVQAEHAALVETMKTPPAPEAPPPALPNAAPPAPPAAPTINPPEAPVPSPELPPAAPAAVKPESRYEGMDKETLKRNCEARQIDTARKRESGLLAALCEDDLARRRQGAPEAPLVGYVPPQAPQAPPVPSMAPPVPSAAPPVPQTAPPLTPATVGAYGIEAELISAPLDDRASFWERLVIAGVSVEEADTLLAARDARFPNR